LPAKFGFAIDCGAERVLASAAADIRVERGEGGGLIVRADGAATGRAVLKSECIPLVLSLARWFVATASAHERRGRMAQVLACGTALPDELNGHVRPIPCAAQPLPGLRTAGALVGLAFGQLEAGTLERLAGHGDGLRLTPWRLVLIEGATGMPRDGDLITRSDDPLLRVVACTGAPGCPQALGATRPFARRLAPSVPEGQIVHIAGCAKGCAHPAPATVTLVATRSGFDLVRNGKASSAPVARSLTEDELLRHASNMAEAV
jgi:precorrin-3B synthase